MAQARLIFGSGLLRSTRPITRLGVAKINLGNKLICNYTIATFGKFEEDGSVEK
jgi:hypothetical protein